MKRLEKEGLRERYHVLYGLSQGLNVATILVGVLAWGDAPWRVHLGMVAVSWAAMFVWRRWGWYPLRDAMERDLEESKAELEAMLARFQ